MNGLHTAAEITTLQADLDQALEALTAWEVAAAASWTLNAHLTKAREVARAVLAKHAKKEERT